MSKYFLILALLVTLSFQAATGKHHKGKHHHRCNGSEETTGAEAFSPTNVASPTPAALIRSQESVRVRRNQFMKGANDTDSAANKKQRRSADHEEGSSEPNPNEPSQILNVSVLHRPQRSPHDAQAHLNHAHQLNLTFEHQVNSSGESRPERSPQMPSLDEHRSQFDHYVEHHRPGFNNSMTDGQQSQNVSGLIGREKRQVLDVNLKKLTEPVKEIVNKTMDTVNKTVDSLLKVHV